MRFLANENFPHAAVLALRSMGHDVTWVRTDSPGMTDPDVLAWAVRENRVLLTFDKDFGELAWRSKLPATSGIVLFRRRMPPPAKVGEVIADILSQRDDWSGHFSVVESDRVRTRKLPAP